MEPDPQQPSVLVIGAMRAGTTALHQHLGSHPAIFASAVKEPHHFGYEHRPTHTGPGDRAFDEQLILDPSAYSALFREGARARHRLESSAMYLYLEGTARRVVAALPDVRPIVVLREPVARAFSSFTYQRLRRFEPEEDFLAALADEARRTEAGWAPIWHYAGAGRYAQQLIEWTEAFGDRLTVLFFEELHGDASLLASRLGEALDIDPAGFPQRLTESNESGVARGRAVQAALQWRPPWFGRLRRVLPEPMVGAMRRVRSWNTKPSPPLDPSIAAALRRQGASDLDELEQVLGRPLPTRWRE